MEFIKKPLYWVPIVFLLVATIGAFAIQSMSKPQLTKNDLHTQFSQFQSYDNETSLLLDEYRKDKITFTYLKLQIEQIKKQILSAGEIYNSNNVGKDFEKGVKELNTLAIAYATNAQRIEMSNGDKKKISEAGIEIIKIDKQVNELIKQYE